MDVDSIVSSVDNYDAIADYVRELASCSESEKFYEQSAGLTQVFGKLAKQKCMTSSTNKTKQKISSWLHQQLQEFTEIQLKNASNFSVVSASTLLKILLIKGKYCDQSVRELMHEILESAAKTPKFREFLEPELIKYDDLRFYLLESLPQLDPKPFVSLMCGIDKPVKTDSDLSSIYATKAFLPFETRQAALKYRGAWQNAWLYVLRHQLTTSQIKEILSVMHARILPNFNKPHLLMDFLTDAYEHGGAVSLLSLNALFVLIQHHSLDYPQFFKKLYELLEDGSLLVSAHRSRFLRMLDLFLTSTHLPATIPASIIKRLARLSLFAPPGAIVAVLPFVYNQLKRHPTCMVMIHRSNSDSTESFDDPFDMDQPDPLISGALDSSLWEIQSLTKHYHPNVASIAKIFSQPFKKPSYQLEHFLSHSYETLYHTEYNRKRDREPALEFENFNVFNEIGWVPK